MKENYASITANRVAISRAAHQLLDRPRVFEDPVALRLIDTKDSAAILAGGRGLLSQRARVLRAALVARSRLAEDELAAAVKRGVRQYVILGAGLDTFAYRSPYSPGQLRVFEVDHPTTQASKRKRLHAAGISIPDGVHFVPVDFETQALADQLQSAGLCMEAPAFFSWLGVTMYLAPETVMSTLRYVRSRCVGGGGIVFDYMTPFSGQSLIRRVRLLLLASRLKAIGEPWIGFFEPPAVKNELRSMGFSVVQDLEPEDINMRYFSSRKDGLRVAGPVHLMSAQA
ncbi:class I SAM-dependent methyltransferase [Noviherbaspirillum galbum]|uniref:S-adenosyl-L-methionine-dependent methyltransferase n=1 Tax=Noviherbaspirillum galbum TaxID=2709383 RepID=A0A6B3SV14_9BURK|nr:class I SAM-dependent methyltransferase [Noviherbaspirillum galbum]NEX62212.1 class I SAM-dependent methyltransferase [Noviherbaspirillum galbum]